MHRIAAAHTGTPLCIMALASTTARKALGPFASSGPERSRVQPVHAVPACGCCLRIWRARTGSGRSCAARPGWTPSRENRPPCTTSTLPFRQCRQRQPAERLAEQVRHGRVVLCLHLRRPTERLCEQTNDACVSVARRTLASADARASLLKAHDQGSTPRPAQHREHQLHEADVCSTQGCSTMQGRKRSRPVTAPRVPGGRAPTSPSNP